MHKIGWGGRGHPSSLSVPRTKGLTERGDQDKAGPCCHRTLTPSSRLIPGERGGGLRRRLEPRGGLLSLNAAFGAWEAALTRPASSFPPSPSSSVPLCALGSSPWPLSRPARPPQFLSVHLAPLLCLQVTVTSPCKTVSSSGWPFCTCRLRGIRRAGSSDKGEIIGLLLLFCGSFII